MTMHVREWMSPDPITIDRSDDVRQVRRLLHQYGIRHLPVVDGGELVGIVSDRDVRLDQDTLDRLGNDDLVGFIRSSRAADEVMSASVHTIGPDDTVAAAARLMLSRRISALPVVTEERALVGMITTTDCLLALLSPEGPAGPDAVSAARSQT